MNINMQIIQIVTLFFSIMFLSFSLFYGFVPVEWICEFHGYIGVDKSCNIRHWVILCISVGFFILANLTFRNFNFRTILIGKGTDT